MFWTTSQQKASLEYSSTSSKVDDYQIGEITKQLALGLSDILPTQWQGIDLLPLVLQKIYGGQVQLYLYVKDVYSGNVHKRHGQKKQLYNELKKLLKNSLFFVRQQTNLIGKDKAQTSRLCLNSELIWLEIPPNKALTLPSSPQPILFVASLDRYLNPMIPVMKQLIELGYSITILLPRVSLLWSNYSRLPQEAHRIFIEDLLTPEILTTYKKAKRQYQHLWKKKGKEISSAFTLENINLYPYIKQDIKKILIEYLPHCIAYMEMAQLLSEQLDIKVALFGRLRRPVENSFFAIFKQNTIFTTMLIHGHLMGDRPGDFFHSGYFTSVDAICVWGQEQRQKLLNKRESVKSEQIFVTGNPAWDRIALDLAGGVEENAKLRRNMAQVLHLNPDNFWITLTTQPSVTCQYEAIQRAVLNVPGAVLLVKVHPAENPNWYYKHCLDEADGRVRIVPHDEVELHPLLRASDVMLTYSSTTNLEAMLLGLPVITVAINSQLAKEERVIRLEDYGLPLVTEEEELTQILKTLMKNDNALGKIIANAGKKALDYLMVNHLDGSATERVVALITKQINI